MTITPVDSSQSILEPIPISEPAEEGFFETARQIIVDYGTILCAKENRNMLAGVLVLTGLGMVSGFVPLFLSEKLSESLSSKEETASIFGKSMSRSALLTTYVASLVFPQLLSSLQNRLCDHLQWNILQQLLQKSVAHFLERPLDFHTQTSVTEMFQLIQKTFSLQALGISILTSVLPTLIRTGITSVCLTYQIGPLAGGSLILLMAVYAFYSVRMTPKILLSREEAHAAWNQTWQEIGNNFARYKLVRDCNQTERVLATSNQSIEKLKAVNLKASQISEAADIGYLLSSYLHVLFLALKLMKNSQNPKEALLFIEYLIPFATDMSGFGHQVSSLFSSYPDLKYVFSKLRMASEVTDSYPDVPLNIDRAPEITFNNIRFQYPTKGEPLFTDLSFTVPAGSKVALVSRSGAGKSSIFQLLYQYYPLSGGAIQIDGQDISKVSLKSLQKQVCLLGQQPLLFQGTIRENILFGAPHPESVSDETLQSLAASIGFDDFFKGFPKGLDTDVGEGGRALSGGQQQKVALIRSLLKTTKIRLLDEATASLDNLSAARMLDALLDRKQDITTLMITHKLTEARKAELILFLEDGKIIAQGTHDELLKTCTPYRELWEAQERGIVDSVTES